MLRTLQRASYTLGLLLLSSSSFSQTSVSRIQSYFNDHCADWKLQPSDVASLEIMSEAPSKAANVTHVYVRQLLNDIPVSNGLATVTLKDGNVLYVANRFKSNLSSTETSPAIDAKAAIVAVTGQLGIVYSEPLKQLSASGNHFVFAKGDASKQDIPVQLMYTFSDGKLRLTWDLSIATTDGQHWWSVRVSAADGTILERGDWIRQCNFDQCADASHQHQPVSPGETGVFSPPPPPGADQYRVYALPDESPNHGNRSLLTNPSDANASPFGWHDTNGNAGDEFTITRGNNVYASEDIDDDDVPGYSPDGTAALNFDFAYDSATGVQGNLDAVITNLFYMNNMLHDVWHYYGFDEASGNFQAMNYSGNGLDNDYVFADAQDGSGTNNANFGTPPDGENPRMQMFLWSSSGVPDLLTVNSPVAIAQSYTSSTAGFGPPIPTIPITEDFVLADDGTGDATDGCEPILNAAAMNGKIALVRRGTCTFEAKVLACQDAGAVAVIVMNNTGGQPIAMGSSGAGGETIPSLMISQANGNTFVTTITGGQTINGTIVNPGDLTAEDSDFDNGVIAHEYGHGISTRLTGGAANSDCLNNQEQMGEGWSDWFGMMLTMRAGDTGPQGRGVGTYVINEPTDGVGIRPAPYSTNFAVNSFTYGDLGNNGTLSEAHGIGFLWTTMLWDMSWALIDQYGFDPNMKTGTGGNNIAMSLVIESLKLQPCGPGFVDGRDAIIAADELLYGGANKCLLWQVFARRGLGFSADQGSADVVNDETEAFDIDPSCQAGAGLSEKGLELVSIYPNPAKDQLNIDMSSYDKVTAIRIVDLQGQVLFETNDITAAKLSVNLSAYRTGVYLVQLTDVNGAKSVAIVKH